MIEERLIEAEHIGVADDGSIHVRDALVIFRDGARDISYPPRFHRYVLFPGDDLKGKPEKIVAIARVVWTSNVIASRKATVKASVI